MGPEATIEKAIFDYARTNGWLSWKFVSPGRKGVPDRLFLSPEGIHVFIEIKAPGKKPTPLQLREIRLINERKGHAFWCDNVDEGIRLLRIFHS